MNKSQLLSVRIDDEAAAHLAALVESYRVAAAPFEPPSKSEVVRVAIEAFHAERCSD